MAVSDWLRMRTQEWAALADTVARLQALPVITLDLAMPGDDALEADAIRRGQRPQQLDALRKALGL